MNSDTTTRLARLGVHVPKLLVPDESVDLEQWAVIACDQHTSEPDYWAKVEEIAGSSPSTLRLIFPEVYLGQGDPDERIADIRRSMSSYLDLGVLRELEPGFMLNVRSTSYVSERQGLLLALDLDSYDFSPDSSSIIRATERTILERLPARTRVRKGAPLELPHVLVLINDPQNTVFGALQRDDLTEVYSTSLMLGGGGVIGYHVAGEALSGVTAAMEALYGGTTGDRPFLFAVGDGNHSLAAAKQVWEEMKGSAPPDHPARYALVEVVNLYDSGLRFEPIHRLVSCADRDEWLTTMTADLTASLRECPADQLQTELSADGGQVAFVAGDRCGIIRLRSADDLPVGIIQDYLNTREDVQVDYIHGWEASVGLGRQDGSVSLLMPNFDAGMLFPTVEKKGVLPRKAFSLGEAEEKRYYLECRRIDD